MSIDAIFAILEDRKRHESNDKLEKELKETKLTLLKRTDKLKQLNIPTTLKLYEGASHAVTVGALSVPFRKQLPLLADIQDFLSSL